MTLPSGFTPVVPTADGRADTTPIKLGIDKRQIVTISFNMLMASRLGLIEQARTPEAEPEVTKKLMAGVKDSEVCLAPVPLDAAGWGLTVTKGQNPRVQVQIPLPALFNVVAEPFRQQSMTGWYEVTADGAVVLCMENAIPALAPKDDEESQPERDEADEDDQYDEAGANEGDQHDEGGGDQSEELPSYL